MGAAIGRRVAHGEEDDVLRAARRTGGRACTSSFSAWRMACSGRAKLGRDHAAVAYSGGARGPRGRKGKITHRHGLERMTTRRRARDPRAEAPGIGPDRAAASPIARGQSPGRARPRASSQPVSPSRTSSPVPPLALAMTGDARGHRLQHRVGASLVGAQHDGRRARLLGGSPGPAARRESVTASPAPMRRGPRGSPRWRGSACAEDVELALGIRDAIAANASRIVSRRLLGAMPPAHEEARRAGSSRAGSRKATPLGITSTRRQRRVRARRELGHQGIEAPVVVAGPNAIAPRGPAGVPSSS